MPDRHAHPRPPPSCNALPSIQTPPTQQPTAACSLSLPVPLPQALSCFHLLLKENQTQAFPVLPGVSQAVALWPQQGLAGERNSDTPLPPTPTHNTSDPLRSFTTAHLWLTPWGLSSNWPLIPTDTHFEAHLSKAQIRLLVCVEIMQIKKKNYKKEVTTMDAL